MYNPYIDLGGHWMNPGLRLTYIHVWSPELDHYWRPYFAYVELCGKLGACSSVDNWRAILQAGRSWDWVPVRSLNFLNVPYPSSHTMALGLTQPLTKWVPEDISGGKAWSARKADNLTTIHKPTDCIDSVETSASHSPVSIYSLLRDIFTFFI
jgi:hypothetical protein